MKYEKPNKITLFIIAALFRGSQAIGDFISDTGSIKILNIMEHNTDGIIKVLQTVKWIYDHSTYIIYKMHKCINIYRYIDR